MANHRNYPIILGHGIFRPDYLINLFTKKLNLSWSDFHPLSDRFHYFRGISSYLRKHGFEVYHTSVSFAAGVETRAKDLRKEILRILNATGHHKVHIIAHSMGGLDARHMIVKENMADKVASLTTIGTPHLGTSCADWGLRNGGYRLIKRFRRIINLEGIKSVTTDACKEFNDFATNGEASNGVMYQTYASAQERELTFLPFQLSWKIIYDNEGENDGLVSVKSQRWADKLIGNNGAVKTIKQNTFPIPADHLDQIGWWHLTGLQKPKRWKRNMIREKRRVEAIVQDIYLKIAKEISTDFHRSSD